MSLTGGAHMAERKERRRGGAQLQRELARGARPALLCRAGQGPGVVGGFQQGEW